MTAHGSYTNSPVSLQVVSLPRRPATSLGMHEAQHPHYRDAQWREPKPPAPVVMDIAQLQAQAELLEMEARLASEEAQKVAEQQFRQMFDSKGVRVTHACEHCRQRKAKCTGTQPCKRCTKQGRLCTFSKIEKKRKVTASLRELAGMHDRPTGMMPWDEFGVNQRRYAPRSLMSRYGSDTPPHMRSASLHGQMGASPTPSVYGPPSVLEYHEPSMMPPPPPTRGDHCEPPMIPSIEDKEYYPPSHHHHHHHHHHAERGEWQGGVAMTRETHLDSPVQEDGNLLTLPPMSQSLSAQSSPLSSAPSLPAM